MSTLLAHAYAPSGANSSRDNAPPVVHAGNDTSVTLPSNTLLLTGIASDADGSIATYNWTKVSGPEGAGITQPDSAATTITNLTTGTYIFRLTVTDNEGIAAFDEVTVVVNPAPNNAPAVHAGSDRVITLPVSTVALDGSATDADGTVAAYQWTKISGPEPGAITDPQAATTTATGLVAGTYVFRLLATDDAGVTAWDEVQVTVNAAPVIAHAGKDTVIFKNQTRPDSAFLNGKLSSGGSGYRWEVLSGPTSPVIQNPDSLTSWVTGITEGAYQFRLTANGTVSDTVNVVVRDWQKKGVYPCRPGYDTTTKTGGLKITLEPNYKGTFLKQDGTTGSWNQWNYILNVRDYVQTTKKTTLYGGDTLLMQGADSTVWVELGGFGGNKGCPVYVMPKGKPVRIRGVNSFFRIATRDSNAVQHVVVDGTALRSAGYPYGFLMDNSNLGYASNGPFTGGWVANFTLKGLRSTKTNALKIKLDPAAYLFSRYDKFVQKNIVLTDNWIDSSSVEGFYIGSTASDGGQLSNPYGPPPRMDSVEISHNIVTNCAWDGIQLANAKNGCIIKHNLVFKVGTANMPSQRAGILMGGNTTGVVDSNIVINSKGNGIQVFGYGDVNVYNNIIDSIYGGKGDQDGMYQSFIVFTSEPSVAPLRMYNYNNLIGRVERSMIRMANTNGRMLPGRTHHNTFIHPTATNPNSLIVTYAKDVLDNNSIVSAFPYKLNSISTPDAAPVISMTQGDTTQAFASIKATVDWLFKRLNGVSPANMPPVVMAGADMRITLPQDSVVISGTATDEDGSIKSYQWKKIAGPGEVLFQTPTQLQTSVKKLTAGQYQFELAATDNGNGIGRDTISITVNTPPVAAAGQDITITLPVNSVQLSGSATDNDGSIATVTWTKISGPESFRLQDTAALQTTVASLSRGAYQFELRVTDNENGVATDTVAVTVNIPPTVSAGPDQTITLPVNALSLQGSASDDDGTVTAVQWRRVSGPSAYRLQDADQVETTVDSLQQGTYLFELTATDDWSAAVSDTVVIIVNRPLNVAPIAFAGTDTLITAPSNSFILRGSGTDEDGTIIAYQWTQLAGPGNATTASPDKAQTTVSGLVMGTYRFELTVTDDRAGTAKDTVTVIVNAPPVVNAGSDQSITLPTAAATLSGTASDADGTIASIQWSKISGPASYIITNPSALQTTVSSLTEGVYQFALQVVDERGAGTSDTVSITVLPKPNVAPTVNAGTDKTITLPTNSITLSGSGADTDGTIATYKWTKVSGPTQGTITTPDAATTTVTGLAAGSYVFRLTVADNKAATAMDDVIVTVNSAPVATSKTINVNIYGGTNAYANSAWNNWSLRTKSMTNVLSSAFKYSDGTASTVAATLSNSSNIADNGAAYSGGMAPAQVLRYLSYHTGTRTLTLKGLSTAKRYTIELFASRNTSGSSTIFTVNGVSQTIATQNNFTNKAVFSNLSANSSGQLVITIAKIGTYNYLNGFSITESSATTTSVTTATRLHAVNEIEPPAAVESFELYPNPVTSNLSLKITNQHTGRVAVQVVAASGRVVRQVQYAKEQPYSQYLLPVHDLAAGVYFIRVQIGDWHTSEKFVKL